MLGKTGPKRIRMISPPRPTSPQFSTSPAIPHSPAHLHGDMQESLLHPYSLLSSSPQTPPSPTNTPQPNVDMADSFFENRPEVVKVNKLKCNLHAYVSVKLTERQPRLSQNIKSFLHSIDPQPQITPSAIHYLPLVDENPDSEDTLLHISEDLLEKLGSDCQDYVFLVGDGKTYQHLMKIKNKYGHTLSKLLIYPGDWHLLKNYQEVLMKQYYYAGLKELAMHQVSEAAL